MNYIGMDVHKKSITMAAFSQDGSRLAKKKVAATPEGITGFLNLLEGGQPLTATMEATGFWYWVAEVLEDIDGVTVKLANPRKVRIIAESNLKNDDVDAAALAHLTRLNWLPESRLVPKKVRLVRERLRCRISLVQTRSSLKNRLTSILLKRGLSHPFSDLFGKKGRAWLDSLDLPEEYRQNMDIYLRLIDATGAEIASVDKWLTKKVKTSRQGRLLTTIPGIGKFSAMLLLAEIGGIDYFKSPKKLSAYAGLAPSMWQSGEKRRLGRLRPDCNKYIRWICIEAVTKAVRVVPCWKRLYDSICCGNDSKKPVARTAVARKIICAAWRVLTSGEPFDHLAAGRRNPKDSPAMVTGLK